jgi:hypothetical protein
MGAQPFLRLADDAATEIVTPDAYIRAVLGDPRATAALHADDGVAVR